MYSSKTTTFTPHMMYSGKKSKMVRSIAEHLRLQKLGWSHTKPRVGGKK
jgi:hypothetical protein